MAKRKSTKGQTTSTKHTHKIKDRITQTPLKTGGKLRCSTSGIRRANLVNVQYIKKNYNTHRQLFL
jgi:hypothetical protein